MKKTFLILLMLVFPLQAFAMAQHNFMHVLGSGSGQGLAVVVKHIVEHANYVLHHHDDIDNDDDGNDDDSGDAHIDKSQKSFQHLADYEQGCSMNILLSASSEFCLPGTADVTPVSRPDLFSNRTTIPLLPPPRALA